MINFNEPERNDNKTPVYFISDTHGSKFMWKWLLTLPKLRNKHRNCIYVILGDMVGLACYSLVNLVAFILLRFLYPENFYLVRGDHELSENNIGYSCN